MGWSSARNGRSVSKPTSRSCAAGISSRCARWGVEDRGVRIDLVLHSLCLFKTRSQASRACADGRVWLNGVIGSLLPCGSRGGPDPLDRCARSPRAGDRGPGSPRRPDLQGGRPRVHPGNLPSPRRRSLGARVIALEHVWLQYAGPAMGYALEDVSLTIEAGELLFLLGPSGAGKTSLLRLITMEEMPVKGRVRVLEFDSARIRPASCPSCGAGSASSIRTSASCAKRRSSRTSPMFSG